MTMKQIIRILLFVGTIISMFFVPWVLVKVLIAPLPDTVQEQVNETIDYGFEGMIVYVNQGGKEPEVYTGGWKNSEKKIPVDPNSLFKIASIGKLYDAVSITKLVSDKRLSLDKTLADYFPELEGSIEYADRITLRMMVKHRSGIPNLTDTPNFWTDPPTTCKEALERILDLPANFAPDEKYEYSNTNYLLISELIEKVAGYDKFQFIKEEILIPLGLKNTFGSIHEVNMDDVIKWLLCGA
jgi:D-alanyl-D-alanine carboxypeptidase